MEEVEVEEVEIYEGKNRTEVFQKWASRYTFEELIDSGKGDAIPRAMELAVLAYMEAEGWSMPKKCWVRIIHDVAASKNSAYASRLEAVRAKKCAENRRCAAKKKLAAKGTQGLKGLSSPRAMKEALATPVAMDSADTLEIHMVSGDISFVTCDSQTVDLEDLSVADLHQYADFLQSMGHPQAVASAVRSYNKLINSIYNATKVIANLQALMPK